MKRHWATALVSCYDHCSYKHSGGAFAVFVCSLPAMVPPVTPNCSDPCQVMPKSEHCGWTGALKGVKGLHFLLTLKQKQMISCAEMIRIIHYNWSKWPPHLRVWYGHPLGLHGGPASHTRGDLRVPSPRARVSASLLQRQLPPTQVRPWRMGPLRLSPVRLSPAVPHAVGSGALQVFGRHGGQGVRETASLFVSVWVQPLAARVTTHSHGGVGRREQRGSRWRGGIWGLPTSINVTRASLWSQRSGSHQGWKDRERGCELSQLQCKELNHSVSTFGSREIIYKRIS